MRQTELPLRVSASAFFSPRIGNLLRPIDPALTRWFFPDRLLRSVPGGGIVPLSAAEFARQLLSNLDIHYAISKQDLTRIPTRGPGLIVANHPFGFLEGLILLSLLEAIRPDYRIVANGILSSVPALRERLLFVNPFGDRAHVQENCVGLRASMEWVQAGGLLVLFPAGEVSHLNFGERPIADPKWNTTAARIARKLSPVAVPLFFEGANSRKFQMVGAIHPRLRTLNLVNELANKCSQTISIHVGTPIPGRVLKSYPNAEAATDYLRARTYLLGSRRIGHSYPFLDTVRHGIRKRVPQALPAAMLQNEIAALPDDRVFAKSDEFTVYLAEAHEIPSTLREIGRCREVTYREAGEGTGKALDLDEFDEYYRHVILWHHEDAKVAGAYRLVATQDIVPKRGIKGLYSSTLFQYEPEFFEHIGPALELGRSFICREYQRRYSSLLLLWKGILSYVVRRPECAVLFGAVSVSSEYKALSRTLIVNFLSGHVSNDAARWIQPRLPFHRGVLTPKHIKQLGRLLPTMDELSSAIQDLEADRKGLPILVQQYLKVGGELLGFNVDPRFSNALDVLLMADLRTASRPMLDRCLGKASADAFRARHERSAT
jgi:putative hemolysin